MSCAESPEEVANSIRMLYQNSAYAMKRIVLVEGDDDRKLFSKLLIVDAVDVIVPGGREKIVAVLGGLGAKFHNHVIAICDADFDHILGIQPISSQLFLTDTHDTETMLLSCPLFDDLVSEWARDHNCVTAMRQGLLCGLLDVAVFLGALRLVSKVNNLNLRFRKVALESYLSLSGLKVTIDQNAYMQALELESIKLGYNTDLLPYSSEIQLHINAAYEPFSICRGHDITELIAIVLRKSELSCARSMSQEKVESSLRLAYSKNHFLNTRLYCSLDSWQSQRMVSIV